VETNIPPFLLYENPGPAATAAAAGSMRMSVVEKSAGHAASLLRAAFFQGRTSASGGFLQAIDARVKLLLLMIMVVVVTIKRTILPEIEIAAFLFGLALLSRLSVVNHYRKIILLTVIFGPMLALPTVFNIFTPGEIVLPVWKFEGGFSLGPIAVPATVGVTAEGLQRVAMLSLRVMNSVTTTFLVLATTPFMELIRALKMLKVPDVFLLTITLAFKYILIFTTTVFDMHLAKMSRMIRPERAADSRAWTSGRIAFLFRKSQQRCDDVVRAMKARGMTSTMKLHPLSPLKGRDAAAVAGVAAVSVFFLWM
jgi:cobalt ECF transporter T component CbiQ